MLKGYVVKERLGTPALQSDRIYLHSHSLLVLAKSTQIASNMNKPIAAKLFQAFYTTVCFQLIEFTYLSRISPFLQWQTNQFMSIIIYFI